MSDVIVTSLPNGPYVVSGPITLKDALGNAFTVDGEQVALCRCGGSANKPFCDGSHQANGFLDNSLAPHEAQAKPAGPTHGTV